jgi:hypothetical protein
MRAHEFITESVTDGLSVASYALPNTYVIPELNNSDFYELYRFGVAIADVRGTSGTEDGVQNKFKHEFKATSQWGEHQVISSEFDADIGQVIDKALAKVNKRGKKLVSTPGSDEIPNTGTQSTLKAFKGYKR